MRGIASERVVIGSNNDDNKNTYQEALLNSNATILYDSIDIWQRRTVVKIWETIWANLFLLELSSVLQNRVPSLGIACARMNQSNYAIKCPERQLWKLQ